MENNMTQHQVLKQNPQYKQKSKPTYINSKHLLTSYICIMYIISFIFVHGSIKYVCQIKRVSQLSIHPLPTITPDNKEYTVISFQHSGNTAVQQTSLNHSTKCQDSIDLYVHCICKGSKHKHSQESYMYQKCKTTKKNTLLQW